MKELFKDKTLNKLYLRVERELGPLPAIKPSKPSEYFFEMAESIVSQQLSVKVADTIFGRVRGLVSKKFLPKELLKLSIEELRGAGLSYSKAAYVQNVAQAWEEGLVEPTKLEKLSDEEVIEKLVQIKGVGRWTAEMFLMFTLGRPDVFSAGDYGLKKAISQAYELPMESKPAVFSELAEQWSPQRTLASRVLWRSLELA